MAGCCLFLCGERCCLLIQVLSAPSIWPSLASWDSSKAGHGKVGHGLGGESSTHRTGCAAAVSVHPISITSSVPQHWLSPRTAVTSLPALQCHLLGLGHLRRSREAAPAGGMEWERDIKHLLLPSSMAGFVPAVLILPRMCCRGDLQISPLPH